MREGCCWENIPQGVKTLTCFLEHVEEEQRILLILPRVPEFSCLHLYTNIWLSAISFYIYLSCLFGLLACIKKLNVKTALGSGSNLIWRIENIKCLILEIYLEIYRWKKKTLRNFMMYKNKVAYTKCRV